MNKPFSIAYGFKSHCTSIHERFSKLEDFLQFWKMNQRNIFPPFGNEFFTPSRNIILKGCPILYPLKQKFICDYNSRCIISSFLIFNDIIMNILRNKKIEFHEEKDDCFLTNIENKTNYMYREYLQEFYFNKGTYKCLYVPCIYYHIKITEMKHDLTNILKSDTSSDDMNEKVEHWLDYFENYHNKYIIMPSESFRSYFIE